MTEYNCILITGPTASGKTSMAVKIADAFNGEIISIDSRQVYRELNIGTGKDLHEYELNGKRIPYHLIDIVEPTDNFNVFDFVQNFNSVFTTIKSDGKIPILCGGSMQYINTLLKQNKLIAVPVNEQLKLELDQLSLDELTQKVESFPEHTNYSFDFSSKKRLIRAIEILTWLQKNKLPEINFIPLQPLIIVPKTTLENRRKKISQRLKDRLDNGMIEEAKQLVEHGVSFEQLEYFGLEYKYLSYYLQEKINYTELYSQLETAIHQYAKRQMTWIRKFEREQLKLNTFDHADLAIEFIRTCTYKK